MFPTLPTVVAVPVSHWLGGPSGGIGAAATLMVGMNLIGTFRRRLKKRDAGPRSVGLPGEPVPKEPEPTSLVGDALKESDPRIYVEIVDGRRELGTPFVLYNRGGGHAYDIQIHPIGLKEGTATFRNIRKISSGERKERLPDFDRTAILQKHDFVALLMYEFKSHNDSTIRELPVHATVTYRDSNSNWFESAFEIVFFPFEEVAPSDWADRPKMVEATKFEYRRLSESESRQLLGRAWRAS